MMDIDKIQSMTGNVVTPVDHVMVKVDFGNGIVEGFASTYVDAMNNKFASRGSSLSFDENEMQRYLNYLLLQRVKYSTGEGKTDRDSRFLKVPALFALSLTHVGRVFDKDLGIELIPVIGEIDAMTPEEALKFSRRLTIVEDLGFELVEGLPKDRNGDSNFMYFHMADDNVKRHNKDSHPGFAVLAAFFKMKQLDEILTFRVTYGLVSEYEEMLKGLIYDESR